MVQKLTLTKMNIFSLAFYQYIILIGGNNHFWNAVTRNKKELDTNLVGRSVEIVRNEKKNGRSDLSVIFCCILLRILHKLASWG
jgi:hypothetical protein